VYPLFKNVVIKLKRNGVTQINPENALQEEKRRVAIKHNSVYGHITYSYVLI